MEITMEMELRNQDSISVSVNLNQREVVETCPHCECENVIHWDPIRQGYMITCQHCGEKMMLCDECIHAEDNECGRCDWHIEGNLFHTISACFRGSHRL